MANNELVKAFRTEEKLPGKRFSTIPDTAAVRDTPITPANAPPSAKMNAEGTGQKCADHSGNRTSEYCAQGDDRISLVNDNTFKNWNFGEHATNGKQAKGNSHRDLASEPG